MADWSYASEELREIKKQLSLYEFDNANKLIKDIYNSEAFIKLSTEVFAEHTALRENFTKWCEFINFEFIDINNDDKVEDEGARGNITTLYGDFFTAFVNDNEDILSMMMHEYFHHVLDRILWNKITNVKEQFTLAERDFIEDMYINAWLYNISKPIADKWQKILVNYDLFHGFFYSEEEKKYNSLLTDNPMECNICVNSLYENLREENIDLLEPRHFAYFVSYWNTLLQEEESIKTIINNLTKEETGEEVYTSCQLEEQERKENI